MNQKEIYEKIIEKDFKKNLLKYNSKGRSKIFYGINLKLIDEVIKEVPYTDFTHQDYIDQLPLHAAALAYDSEIFDVILHNTPTEYLNKIDVYINTPLQTLISNDEIAAAEKLIARNPDLADTQIWNIIKNEHRYSDDTIRIILKQLDTNNTTYHGDYPYTVVSKRVQKLLKEVYSDVTMPGEFNLMLSGKE